MFYRFEKFTFEKAEDLTENVAVEEDTLQKSRREIFQRNSLQLQIAGKESADEFARQSADPTQNVYQVAQQSSLATELSKTGSVFQLALVEAKTETVPVCDEKSSSQRH